MNLSILLETYRANQTQIEQLTEQQKAIKQVLTENLKEGETLEHDGIKTAWTRPRVNNRLLEQAFPQADYPQLYKPTIDSKAVAKHVAPDVLDQYRDGQPTLRISL